MQWTTGYVLWNKGFSFHEQLMISIEGEDILACRKEIVLECFRNKKRQWSFLRLSYGFSGRFQPSSTIYKIDYEQGTEFIEWLCSCYDK